MDDISIACGKRSCVRRRRFLSIERGEVGRERQPTCLGAGIEKCLPARRDQMSRGAPHLKRLTTGACLWQETVQAMRTYGLQDHVSHLSIGGRATLKLLEGRELPGLQAMRRVTSRESGVDPRVARP
ncbi:MAG: hypothetical protein ACLPTJ_17710 [Solirubrobacteraceae bacterium]